MTFPDDSIQSAVLGDADWWVSNDDNSLCRGALIFAFVPHVDQVPYTLEPVGRKDPTQHGSAEVRIKPLNARASRPSPSLPVAAMPLYHGEFWTAYKAKRRPCIVFSNQSPSVSKSVVRGAPKRNTAPTVLVAPYYGVDQDGKRAGYNPVFIERVRHCEYPQFFWDKLPIGGSTESLLRLDHLQPIGAHHQSYDLSNFKLSEPAMEILDEMLEWLMQGMVHEDSFIAIYREIIEDTFDEKN